LRALPHGGTSWATTSCFLQQIKLILPNPHTWWLEEEAACLHLPPWLLGSEVCWDGILRLPILQPSIGADSVLVKCVYCLIPYWRVSSAENRNRLICTSFIPTRAVKRRFYYTFTYSGTVRRPFFSRLFCGRMQVGGLCPKWFVVNERRPFQSNMGWSQMTNWVIWFFNCSKGVGNSTWLHPAELIFVGLIFLP
jgi:hypothetical protein